MDKPIINYYALLGLTIYATPEQIQTAMRHYAQQPNAQLDVLQAIRTRLLDAEQRKRYDQELLAAYPEILEQMKLAVAKQQWQTKTRREQLKDNAAKAKEQTRGCLDFVALIVTGLVISVIFATCSGGGSGGSSPKAPDKLDEWSAQVACQDTIKDRLKAPATAQFDNWIRSANADGTYTITGTVDSQNAFGAMLRSKFSCRVSDNGNGTAHVSVTSLTP